MSLGSDRAMAMVAVRVCDIWPDGRSTLITRGLLNLTHRDSHEHPSRLEPGCRYQVQVVLNAIAYAVPKGHRLRLAISPDYWPWAWPSPELVTLSVFTGEETFLETPECDVPLDGEPPEHFQRPERAADVGVRRLGSRVPGSREVRHDLGSGAVSIVHELGYLQPIRILDTGTDYFESGRDVYTVVENEPLSAETHSERSVAISRRQWETRIKTSSTLSATLDAFHVTNLLEAFEGNRRVFAKTWHSKIPRDFT